MKIGIAAHRQVSANLHRSSLSYIFSRQIGTARYRHRLLLKLKALTPVREHTAKLNRKKLKVTKEALITWRDCQPVDDKKL